MTGNKYKLKILQECGKRVKTKSQKVLGANSYVCRSYRGKTGMGGGRGICPPPHPEGVKSYINCEVNCFCAYVFSKSTVTLKKN